MLPGLIETANRIIESRRLEKILKVIESQHNPGAAKAAEEFTQLPVLLGVFFLFFKSNRKSSGIAEMWLSRHWCAGFP